MPRPRKHQICLEATLYYHCISRCVRRSFLCGFDKLTNRCFEHRKAWLEERLLHLATIFAIDICAYAIMSNHHHLVLHVNLAETAKWTDLDVVKRWHRLYKPSELTLKFEKGEPLSEVELDVVQDKIKQWRERLTSISEFMKNLNEPIARQANIEDKCTGAFFEGRFKSQALLDEKALVACMAYVDLNPIRAKKAKTPETSEHTSIKKRLDTLKEDGSQPSSILPFVGNPREPMPVGLPFHVKDYVELVDWTGRILRSDKHGAISENQPQILERLDIDAKKWLTLSTQFESRFKILVGASDRLKLMASAFSLKRSPYLKECQYLFG